MNATPTTPLQVNGNRCEIALPEDTTLLLALREELGLRGIRSGCTIGECGACRVLVDGRGELSCQLRLGELSGAHVTTPEGLGGPQSLGRVQQAFFDEQAGQCGYCINGMITAVADYLQQAGDRADEASVRAALDSQTCRCGTHVRILRAARRLAGLDPREPEGPVDLRLDALPGDEPGIPPALETSPLISDWVEVRSDGDIVFHPGKVELGQGMRTALTQIVASQLGLPPGRVHADTTSTDHSPDQGQTSGSLSVEHGGTALAMAATALRRTLLDVAARLLGSTPDRVSLSESGASDGTGRSVSWPDLGAAGTGQEKVLESDLPTWESDAIGAPLAREDLRVKMSGAPAYVQDLAFPGMLYARAILPQTYRGTLVSFDLERARNTAGVEAVVQDGRLILVIGATEHGVVKARDSIAARTRWTPARAGFDPDLERFVRGLPSREYVRRRDEGTAGALAGAEAVVAATYLRPYQSHGPMSPSAAVAVEEGGRLHVWTHSQGVHPLRREIAAFLEVPESAVVVQHQDGPGCYGLTCSDDAALLAALAARSVPGRPVRFQFTIDQEFAWDPYGPAMLADLSGSLGPDGRIAALRNHVWSDSHSTRANGDGDRLFPAWITERNLPRPWVGLDEPSARNALPMYDVPLLDVTAHNVRGPLRTGSLRSLGAFFNVFATESFMDEMACAAGIDPLEFRLRHLTDQRAIDVLEIAAARAGWQPRTRPSGRGMGIALARYKDTKTYVGMVVELSIDADGRGVEVRRVTVAADAGTVINADGLRNQLEGGVVQGLSRTLFEEVPLLRDGPPRLDWSTYPRIGFRQIPDIDVVLVSRPGMRPLGAGEASTPATPAAVANAIDDAIGVRMREIPFTWEKFEKRLAELTEEESDRVLI